ncbi:MULTISPECIES: serine/threonine-protein kinase [unclassified Streptomyces]|uniref:serine/threonine-protein kinase n=1 Tax=unclassified Streptomyces TaxID=2593676 RepID=UPI00224D78CC|nr:MULTISPECIES: serine/threonine-protein kinase [unclassified Streptomyces]MCX4991989.1 protein kinase [Streptomyces sp. NBC_00568]MCX5002775.1 protein kinase [Streptomyces sp. NBC_00638]
MSEDPGSERVIAGRYRLLSPLGEGGMGTVWRARDEVLQREVAVKEVRAPAGLPASEVERMYARLEREAWAAARISNRNVVTVYDVATQDGRPWIVMELIRGISLADLLDAEGPLTPERAAHIGAEVLAALRAAHEAGVLHRDVKPGNVLMANDGRVVLTDFGIATVEGSSALTMTGEVIGSPEFLAPERALGRTPGPESDLWSLGVLLYAAVEGNSPFRQNTPLSTLRAIVDEPLPVPRRAGRLAPVLDGLLAKDPAERTSADSAEHQLRVVAGGGAAPTRPAVTAPTPSDTPTIGAFNQPSPASPTPPRGFGPPPATVPSATPPAEPDRNRRAAVALIAGLVALALALGGLTYALLNRDDGKGGNSGQATTNSGGTGNSDGGDSGGEKSESGSATAGATGGGSPSSSAPGGGGSTTAPPAQSVRVTVSGHRTDYKGACPPPATEAPSFTATFTVGRVPVDVEYRWVTKSGDVTDPSWKTLAFPAGGGRTQQKTVVATTYDASGTFSNEISVEVRGPVKATSNSVPFTITCVTETPTDGASASASP